MRTKKDNKCPFCGLVGKHIRNCHFFIKVPPEKKIKQESLKNKRAIILDTDTK